MRKMSFLSVFVLVVLVSSMSEAGEKVSSAGKRSVSCQTANVVSASIPSEPIANWQRLEDPTYGYAVEFPADGWEATVAIEQAAPFSDPKAILKRVTFLGAEGLIDLDIWSSHGSDFVKWLAWYSKTRNNLPSISPNATISGYPAIVFLEDGIAVDMLTAFWADGEHVFRLWYTVTQNENGLDVFWHLLERFEHFDRAGAIVHTEIPESVKETSRQAMTASGIASPLVTSCCGYSSFTNPFPCCDNKGNCTWWVYYSYGGVPFRYDAYTWWGQVPDYPAWDRKAPPPPIGKRSIAYYQAGHPTYPNGHVAYVGSYSGGSNVTVSYMGYCVNCGTTQSISVYQPNGYIFLKYEPTALDSGAQERDN